MIQQLVVINHIEKSIWGSSKVVEDTKITPYGVNIARKVGISWQATEEAIINSLIAAKTMTGIDNYTVESLPTEKVIQILQNHNLIYSADN